jgi:hypothetical protein
VTPDDLTWIEDSDVEPSTRTGPVASPKDSIAFIRTEFLEASEPHNFTTGFSTSANFLDSADFVNSANFVKSGTYTASELLPSWTFTPSKTLAQDPAGDAGALGGTMSRGTALGLGLGVLGIFAALFAVWIASKRCKKIQNSGRPDSEFDLEPDGMRVPMLAESGVGANCLSGYNDHVWGDDEADGVFDHFTRFE